LQLIFTAYFILVFSIVNEEPNAEECKAKVRKYEEENKNQIVIRQSQRADEDRIISDRIAAERREAERRKREFFEVEEAILRAKRRYKQEATQVSLGEREEVSRELVAAQMKGYRNEIINQRRGKAAAAQAASRGPRVREPTGGLKREPKLDRELYRKRQAAGGGVPSGSIQFQERNWNFAVESLFSGLSF